MIVRAFDIMQFLIEHDANTNYVDSGDYNGKLLNSESNISLDACRSQVKEVE